MNTYKKLVNGVPNGYPIIESNLRQLFPNLPEGYLFPATVEAKGYCVFEMTTPPISGDITKEYTEGTPVKNSDGIWVQEWTLTDITFTDQEAKDKAVATANVNRMSKVRLERAKLLIGTDFYALSDVTMSDEMTTYRQALRDLPSTVDINNIIYPEKPEE